MKRSIGALAARGAYETAFCLEKLGHDGKLTDAEGVFERLEAEIDRLQPEMESQVRPGSVQSLQAVGHS